MFPGTKPTRLDGYGRGIGVRSIVIVLMCLASCTPSSLMPEDTFAVGDGGFLSEEPCGPPCFWGIVPGETTEAEVIEILREKGVFDTCETFDREARGGERGMECGSRVFISFQQGGDVIQGLGFSPTSTITVQDVVEKYGEPQSVEVGALGVHVLDYQLILAYPKILTLVRLSLQQEYPYVLEPVTPVKDIVYYLEFGGDFSLKSVWHGYGEYR